MADSGCRSGTDQQNRFVEGQPARCWSRARVYLVGWAIFTAYMFIASTRTNLMIMAVFAALTLTFVFLALGFFELDVRLVI